MLTLPAQAVYICAYYRPDVSDEESLKQFETSVRRATTSRNAQILVAGDMNFPGPDWISDSDAVSIKPLSPYPRLSQRFLDLTADIGLEQVVHEATREGNTFDLVLTNRPDLVPRVETVPRTSDHEIVYFEFLTCLPKKINNPRPISLCNKANWDAMREDKSILREKMSTMEQDETTPVEEMWQQLKTVLLESVLKYIPHKNCPEEIIKSLDLSGTTPTDQKTRSEIPPDEETAQANCRLRRRSCRKRYRGNFTSPTGTTWTSSSLNHPKKKQRKAQSHD